MVYKTLMAAVMGMYMAIAPAKAEPQTKGSAELMAGQETATLDTKLSVPVAPRTSVFSRNRITSDYEGNIGSFHLFKLDFKVIDGLGLCGGLMGTSAGGLKPNIGPQYFGKFGNFSAYGTVLVSAEEKPVATTLVNFGYYTELSDAIGLVFGLENVTAVNGKGHIFSTQRGRVGIGFGNLQFGLAGDIVEAGNKGKFSYNVGAYGKAKF
ncbi:hypothetical protein KY339_04080 [Candidatus Woesearchaeota archaeon]|nr:hypothetical protein [Candidatus Woesearchaeota archaeon]